MQKNYLRAFLATFVFVLSFSMTGLAQTAPQSFPNVKIINFGQMDERFYRGGQPLQDDYRSLKELGVKTVIDLRNDPTDYEKTEVEALGMKYVNIPMSGWKYPKVEQIEKFKQVMNDPETGVVYVHCKAGKHRTGITGAVYRFENYGWDYEKAYKEMKNYNFTSWMVHGRLKTFVEDYAEKKSDRAKLSKTQTTSQIGQ
jgi:protein tyrosine/serine phosphatase